MCIKERTTEKTTGYKLVNPNNMNNPIEIAQTSFKEISRRFPGLKMHIHADAPVELCMDIPRQENLAFDVHLNLQNNDELHLASGHFWCEWFPCSEQKKADQYIDAVSGLLAGKYRIVEHYHGKKAVKAELQIPENDRWKTIAAWATFYLPFPWLKKHYEVLQNV